VAALLFWPLVVILVTIIVLFWFVFSLTIVEGDSMLPNLVEGDRLLVTRGYDQPAAGDIVIFTLVEFNGTSGDLVKRVVAVPGDTISTEAGVPTVNGVTQPTAGYLVSPGDFSSVEATVVAPDTVFVMGDNRPISLDSRYLGTIPLEDVQGKAVAIIWPPSRAEWF